MKYGKEINQACKTAFLFLSVTSIFALLGKLSILLPLDDSKVNLGYFLKVNLLWLITVIVILLSLALYIKKTDGQFDPSFLHDPRIQLTSGLLILLEGVINLSNKASVLFVNIQTLLQAADSMGENADQMVSAALASNAIPILAYLLQILLGLYFILHKRRTVKSI